MQGPPHAPGSVPVETCQSRCSSTKLSLLSLCLWDREKGGNKNCPMVFHLPFMPLLRKTHITHFKVVCLCKRLLFSPKCSLWLSNFPVSVETHGANSRAVTLKHIHSLKVGISVLVCVCLYLNLQHLNKHELLEIGKYIMLSQMNLCLSDTPTKKWNSMTITPNATLCLYLT